MYSFGLLCGTEWDVLALDSALDQAQTLMDKVGHVDDLFVIHGLKMFVEWRCRAYCSKITRNLVKQMELCLKYGNSASLLHCSFICSIIHLAAFICIKLKNEQGLITSARILRCITSKWPHTSSYFECLQRQISLANFPPYINTNKKNSNGNNNDANNLDQHESKRNSRTSSTATIENSKSCCSFVVEAVEAAAEFEQARERHSSNVQPNINTETHGPSSKSNINTNENKKWSQNVC